MASLTKENRVRPRDGILRSAAPLSESPATDGATTSEFAAARIDARRDWAYLFRFLSTSIPLWAADQVSLLVSAVIAYLVAAPLSGLRLEETFGWTAGLAVLNTLTCWMFGLYPAVGLTTEREIRFSSWSTLVLFVGAALQASWGATAAVTSWLLAGCVANLVIAPYFRRTVRRWMAGYLWWAQPALIFGGGASGAAVYRALEDAPECGLRPIGIIDELPNHWSDESVDPAWYLGPESDAMELARRHGVFWAIVPLQDNAEKDFASRLSRTAGLLPHVAVTFADWTPLALHTAGAKPLLGIPSIQIDEQLLIPMQRLAKRVLDLTLLVLVTPVVFALIAILGVVIKLTSPGPVFFAQERIGYLGERFKVWKLRTMVVDAEQVLKEHLAGDQELSAEWNQFHKLRRDPRVTPIGRFLRKTSLDELPQIWNVIRGDMSFVGPRPYAYYEYEQLLQLAPVVLRVRPGITGLWQISGRNRSTFEERMRIETGYVRDWSPWLDVYILARTIRVVLTCDGAC